MSVRVRLRSIIDAILRREDGAALIEVMVSAVLVVTVATAVLNGVDGSVKTAAKNRARSVAAALAEQDLERLRAFQASKLSGLRQTRTVTVNGVPYSVASRADWVRDSSGTVSCTNDSSLASYLKLTSTVSPTGGRPGKPVTATSLIAPSNGSFAPGTGSLAVLVVDRSGSPRAGLTVNINGSATSASDTTNDAGCAVFNYIPSGNYTVTASAVGLVDRDGQSNISQDAGVVDGSTTLHTMELDVPVSINVAFDTKVGTAAAVPAAARAATVANPGLPSPGRKTISVGGPPANPNTILFNPLFPFTGGYGVYGGSCAANDPTTYDPNYYTTNPGLVSVSPGAPPYSVTVRLPAIRVEVRNSSNAIMQNARVFVTPTDTSCGSTYPSQLTNASGAMPKPGFPFGTYDLCADNGTGRRRIVAGVANTNPAGTSVITMTLPNNGNTPCP